MKSEVLHFSEATLIDSSTIPRPIAVLQDGKVLSKDDNCPQWVQKSLEIVERLEQKLKPPESKT